MKLLSLKNKENRYEFKIRTSQSDHCDNYVMYHDEDTDINVEINWLFQMCLEEMLMLISAKSYQDDTKTIFSKL